MSSSVKYSSDRSVSHLGLSSMSQILHHQQVPFVLLLHLSFPDHYFLFYSHMGVCFQCYHHLKICFLCTIYLDYVSLIYLYYYFQFQHQWHFQKKYSLLHPHHHLIHSLILLLGVLLCKQCHDLHFLSFLFHLSDNQKLSPGSVLLIYLILQFLLSSLGHPLQL